MPLTPEQIKGRIKNIAKDNNADARILLRIHMMERLLERISVSNYRNKKKKKGGLLVTALCWSISPFYDGYRYKPQKLQSFRE